MKSTSRRNFISNTTKAGIAAAITVPVLGSLLSSPAMAEVKTLALNIGQDTGFDQQPLTYAYNALEPSIDALTMEIHYSKHAAAYCKNLKEAAATEKVDTTKPLENVLANISKYSVKMRNNAGGHYNHELFWKSLSPVATQPSGKLLAAINSSFGSPDEMKKQFNDAAKARFGSGWAWLMLNNDKKLIISSTPNQDNPLMDIAEVKGFPLVGLDVWEHAYYLKYQNRRAEYVDSFWKILNWDFLGNRFDSI